MDEITKLSRRAATHARPSNRTDEPAVQATNMSPVSPDRAQSFMALQDELLDALQRLPKSLKAEALDFVQYLLAKAERDSFSTEDAEWSLMSLGFALRGMEDDPGVEYTLADLKESFS